jgi:hypothetical protein
LEKTSASRLGHDAFPRAADSHVCAISHLPQARCPKCG